MDKARIADHEPLQSEQLIQVDRLATGFANGPAPTLNTILRRSLPLDGVGGLRPPGGRPPEAFCKL